MNALPKNHKFGRVKEKYNPKPNAQEKAHHEHIIKDNLCVCGCGGVSVTAHHVMQPSEHKRWRRDHRIVVPMTHECHRALHDNGNEVAWQECHGIDLIHEAQMLWNETVYKGRE